MHLQLQCVLDEKKTLTSKVFFLFFVFFWRGGGGGGGGGDQAFNQMANLKELSLLVGCEAITTPH